MFYKAKADLHLHTEASDGILTPSELVREAKAKELQIISITDHDTIAGVEEAIRYGNKIGVKVIPGIELSTMHNGESIHILGYFKGINYKDKNFRRTLEDMTDFRISRGQKIVNNLEKYFGIRLNYENILKEAKGVIARPHIAKAIVDSGYNYDWEYIFHNIIGEDSPAYVPKKNLTIQEGIDLLKSVNALAVLAHPIVYKKNPIEELVRYDFDGIEAIYHMNTEEVTNKFIQIAKSHGKIITAGSDFHGIDKKDNSHGSVGCVYLSDNDLNIFLEHITNI